VQALFFREFSQVIEYGLRIIPNDQAFGRLMVDLRDYSALYVGRSWICLTGAEEYDEWFEVGDLVFGGL
jgi:hypothetical protein